MKKHIQILSIALGLILSYHCSVNETNNTETIPFILTDHNNMAISGVLNATDTVNLMFHTGANDISITQESAKRLKSIQWGDKLSDIKTWGGSDEQRVSFNNSVQISNFQWDSLAIWENKNSGPTTDGKFGPNMFEGKFIEINFDEKHLKIHNDKPEKINQMEKLPLKYENGNMFIELSCEIGDQKISNDFLIHSGYAGGILFDDQFADKNSLADYVEITDTQELKDSFGNVLKTQKGNLDRLWFGKEELKNVPVGFFEGAIGRQKMSVVGGDVLKRFNLVIDSSRENIYLKTNSLTLDQPERS